FEVEVAAQYFEFYGGLVNALGGETIDLGPGYHSYTRREPFGVVGVILPWNAPLNQAARAAAPALAAGNEVVAKPSEFPSASLLEVARMAVDCGLPAGALDVVTGTGPEAGAALVAHGGVRKVAFTGSLRAGREIAHLAADRILPLTLELGGKSPNLVFADADLEHAVPGSLRAFVTNAGQVCSAGTRLLLERGIHDRFVTALADAMKGVRPGRVRDALRRRGRGSPHRERLAVRARRRHLDARPGPRPPRGRPARGWAGLRERVDGGRRRDPLRRLQAERHRAREGTRGPPSLHAAEVRDDQDLRRR